METVDTTGLYEVLGTWGTLILFAMFFLYQYFKERNRSKSEAERVLDRKMIFNHIKIQTVTMQRVEHYLKVVTEQFNEEITRTQANLILEKLLALTSFKIIGYGLEIINKNNIAKQKREIRSKVTLYIENLCQENQNTLGEFKYKGIRMDELIQAINADQIANEVIEIIIENKRYEVLISYIENTFNQILEEKRSILNKHKAKP